LKTNIDSIQTELTFFDKKRKFKICIFRFRS